MITGFNTDVRHGDVVFHVQTEDKGTDNPCVESLVYVGGQILARRRSGYQKLLGDGGGLDAVARLMEKQHKTLIQEIRSGGLDDKLPAAKRPVKPAAAAPAPTDSTRVEPPAGAEGTSANKDRARQASQVSQEDSPSKASEPAASEPAEPVGPTEPAEPVGAPQPQEAREPSHTPAPRTYTAPGSQNLPIPPLPSRPSNKTPPEHAIEDDRSLDQVILDYLEMESDQEKLILTMDQKEGKVKAGHSAVLAFRTESSLDSDPIGEVVVTIRLISTLGEPQVLAKGVTDDNGELVLSVEVPELPTASGALIVSAESVIGYAEERHLI